MKKQMLLLLGCCLAVAVTLAQTTRRELWVWKDANGVTHYSDVPAPGARRMTVASGEPSLSSPPPETSPAPGEGSRLGEGAAPVIQYSSLEFTVPEEGATFFEADAAIDVQVSSSPGLAPGDRLLINLDGRPVDAAENSYQHTLTGLERGVHTLTAVILDAQGNEKISSAPRSFNVRINVVNNPRTVGPSLKPKPTPLPTPPPPTPTPPKSPK